MICTLRLGSGRVYIGKMNPPDPIEAELRDLFAWARSGQMFPVTPDQEFTHWLGRVRALALSEMADLIDQWCDPDDDEWRPDVAGIEFNTDIIRDHAESVVSASAPSDRVSLRRADGSIKTMDEIRTEAARMRGELSDG